MKFGSWLRRRHSVMDLIGLGATAVSLFGTTACSLLLSNNDVQCSTDGDCRSKGLSTYVCGGEGVCIPPPQIVGPTSDPAPSCATDDGCITANGGRAARCPTPGGQCVNLANDYCDVAGDFKDRNAIFIGNLKVDKNPDGALSSKSQGFMHWPEIAHGELTSALAGGGIAGGVNGARRPLVLVSCEGGALEPDTVKAIAAHLLISVKTPAVIASDARPAADLWSAAAALNKPVVIFANGLGDMRAIVKGTGDGAFMFNSVPPITQSAIGMSAWFTSLESKIRAAPNFDGPDIRVTQLLTSAPSRPEYGDLTREWNSDLNINGQPASQQIGVNYEMIGYDAADGSTQYSQAALATATFRPHAIAISGAIEFQRVIMPLVESFWAEGEMRPFYGGSNEQIEASMPDAIGASEDLRPRIAGSLIGPAPDGTRFVPLMNKFSQTFPGIAPGIPLPYDQFFQIAYAIVAAGQVPDGQPGPDDIVRGLKQLQSGKKIYTGGDYVTLGMNELIDQGSIDLYGAGGHMNLDFGRGYVAQPQSPLFCFSRNPDGTVSGRGVNFGVFDFTLMSMLAPPHCSQ